MKNKINADSKYIWMDGRLQPYSDAQIHVLTHSLHYGCSAFEGFRSYLTSKGYTAMFRAVEHYQRFFDSIRVLGYSISHTLPTLIEATKECIKANQFRECYTRPIAYVDDSVRGLRLPENPSAVVAIATWEWGKYMGDEGQKNGVRIKTSTYRRADVASGLHLVKLSGNYVTSVMARREATQQGFDEALLLDQQGFVAEGSGENIFMVKGGEIHTPPLGSILPGITRNSVIQMARDLGFQVTERNITRAELYLADEAFFTGTAVEVTPIREIDHHKIADGKPGRITNQLMEQFFKCVRGELPKYSDWLTKV